MSTQMPDNEAAAAKAEAEAMEKAKKKPEVAEEEANPGTKKYEVPLPSDWGADFVKVDKHQNPWTAMTDYIKTVITLASAILGFSVTFANSLVGTAPSFWMLLSVGLAWFALIVTILVSLYAIGLTNNYLRGKRNTIRPVPFLCNVTYIALGIALVLFALAGGMRLFQMSKPPAPPKPQQAGYMKKLGEIGPFDSGAASLCPPKERPELCDARLNSAFGPLPVAKLPHAPGFLILVGSADRERLTPAALHLYGSNAGLARGRSEWVQAELSRRFPDALKNAEYISLFTGPNPFENATHPRSEPDRRVEIWAGALGD